MKSLVCFCGLTMGFLFFAGASWGAPDTRPDSQPSSQPASSPAPMPLEKITGIYGLTHDKPFDKSLYDLDITGFAMRVYWKQIEPEKGKFDWSLFDETIENCERTGKVAKIFILFGAGVPDWVECEYIIGSDEEWNRTYRAAGAKVPIPWDPVLLREEERLIRTVGERYRDNPTVAFFHVAGPSARWAELALPTNIVDVPGYSNERVLECWKRNIDLWNEVRGNKRLSLSLSASPPFYENLGHDIASYAVGDPENAEDHGALGSDTLLLQWCYLDGRWPKGVVRENTTWGPKTLTGWQFWATTVLEGRETQDYEGIMRLAMDHGSTIIEVYDVDLLIAEPAKIAEQIDKEMKERVETKGK